MGYASLRETLTDLERTAQLVRVAVEVDPVLEAAELQRRVYAAGGPALLFERVKGTRYPMASNLFGTMERTRFLFRDALDDVRALVDAKVDPRDLVRHARRALGLPRAALHLLPREVSTGPVMDTRIALAELPRLVSWPLDGGPFVTLPQVYTEDPDSPGLRGGNLGMYRVQLAGNEYAKDEIGLHYQIHRGIGVHHAAAIAKNAPLPVSIFVGGPPAMSVAAVMPLPEGLPELAFAGALNRRRVRMVRPKTGAPFHAEADFVIRGFVMPHETKPEGPFGDHLGYYSNIHDFPVMHVTEVLARRDAIWPFTAVGRPPQEDTQFGALIHELTGPLVPTVLPGVREVNAVDEAGVHPLLLAIGSERYVPYTRDRRPMEVLTQACAILGQGQMSLAKFLFVAARQDDESLTTHDVPRFFEHVLERLDPTRDLHFLTNTTMDTLDYSGTGLNAGSKVIVAAVGEKRRTLAGVVPSSLRLPDGFGDADVAMRGVLAVSAPPFAQEPDAAERLASSLPEGGVLDGFPLIVVVDDAGFTARTIANFLWVTFTRANPAVDVHGVGAFVRDKAWGCRGSVIVDARVKPHHAAALVEDPGVARRVDEIVKRTPGLSRWG
jgi:4-hydroxy-3-polyprenylbenzoate decarboxylase